MIRAVTDRVFIRLESPQNDGLIGDCQSQNYRTVGEVVSIGELVNSVQLGDRVLFHIFDELPLSEENLVAVRESSILGVWENDRENRS